MKYTWVLKLLVPIVAVISLAACSGDDSIEDVTIPSDSLPEVQLSSSAFTDGSSIPEVYTCDGADVSPALSWIGLPSDVQSLALIVDDPDAPRGTWVHWVMYGLSADQGSLPQGASGIAAIMGTNDFGDTLYGGPCPPSGPAHRYFFKLYALDSTLDLEAGATKPELLSAMEGHIIAQGTLMGTYQR